MFAIIETGGKQYRVEEGRYFKVERVHVDAGAEFVLDKVLLVNKAGAVSVGAPYVADAKVTCEVLEHGRGKKVITFKKRRRKHGSQRKRGHRQYLTLVRIGAIAGA